MSFDDPNDTFTWELASAFAQPGSLLTVRRVRHGKTELSDIHLHRTQRVADDAVRLRDLLHAARTPDLRRHRLYFAIDPVDSKQHIRQYMPFAPAPSPAAPFAYSLDPPASNIFWKHKGQPWFASLLRARTDSCVTRAKLHLWQPDKFPDPYCACCGGGAGHQVVDDILHWLSGYAGGAGLCRVPGAAKLICDRHNACLRLLALFLQDMLGASARWELRVDHPAFSDAGCGATIPPSLAQALPTAQLRRQKPDVVFLLQRDAAGAPSQAIILDMKVPEEHSIGSADRRNLAKYHDGLGSAITTLHPACVVHTRTVIIGARATLPHHTRAVINELPALLGAEAPAAHIVEKLLTSMLDEVASHTGRLIQTHERSDRPASDDAQPMDAEAATEDGDYDYDSDESSYAEARVLFDAYHRRPRAEERAGAGAMAPTDTCGDGCASTGAVRNHLRTYQWEP